MLENMFKKVSKKDVIYYMPTVETVSNPTEFYRSVINDMVDDCVSSKTMLKKAYIVLPNEERGDYFLELYEKACESFRATSKLASLYLMEYIQVIPNSLHE